MNLSDVALTYVEVDINYCANSYGIAPCTAAGSSKCWNTRNLNDDCQDPANFTPSTKTLIFAKDSEFLLPDVDAIPNVIDFNITTPMIKPAENMGERFAATIKYKNHPHGDAGLDKYWGERSYIASDQGTFWGRFRARNPFTKGNAIRLKQGFADWDYADFDTYNLIIDDFAGPDSSGVFTHKAVDIFRLLDNDKAQAPEVSNGYLASAIVAGASSLTLAPSGIGDLNYPASGKASIGKEIVSYTRSGDTVTLTARGLHDTVDEDHDDEDTFQIVLEYSPQTVDLIIEDLITTYTDLTSANIPSADWANEIASSVGVNYAAVIAKPTGVRQLINELIEQAGLVMWPDVSTNQVRMQVLRSVTPNAKSIDDNVMLPRSFTSKDQQQKRIGTMVTWYNQRNPLEQLTEQKNYYSGLLTLGSNSDQYTNAAITTVYSRWIPQYGRGVVEDFNARKLSRFEAPPRQFSFKLPRSFPIEMGQGVYLSHSSLENCDGSQASVPAQVVSIGPGIANRQIVAEEMNFVEQENLGAKQIVFDSSAPSIGVNLRTAYNATYSTLDPTETITVRIESNATLGGAHVGGFALYVLDTDWPVGVTINIIVTGRAQGAGGKGGNGNYNVDGQDGGGCLYIRRPVTIDNTSGEIYGGAGGGGGTGRLLAPDSSYASGGGGGGAGTEPGAGGIGPYENGATVNYLGDGDDGTRDTGGTGGVAFIGGAVSAGDGGDAGEDGEDATGGFGVTHGLGGSVGVAVDGDSYVTWTALGDVKGARIN